MSAVHLLRDLESQGFRLAQRDGRIAISPASRLTPELRAAIREHKPQLLELLKKPPPIREQVTLVATKVPLAEPWNGEEAQRLITDLKQHMARYWPPASIKSHLDSVCPDRGEDSDRVLANAMKTCWDMLEEAVQQRDLAEVRDVIRFVREVVKGRPSIKPD